MKIMSILLPVMFLVACIVSLILMTQYSVTGGDWDTINGWLILLIPSLLGIIIGLYILFNRR